MLPLLMGAALRASPRSNPGAHVKYTLEELHLAVKLYLSGGATRSVGSHLDFRTRRPTPPFNT